MKNGALKAVGSLEELYTSLNLPLKIALSVNGAGEMLAEVLRTAGAVDVVYKTGSIVADIPRMDKIKILSVLMEQKEGVKDLSIREPNLEEVFFGVH